MVQLELPLEINKAALQLARDLGVKTILNPSPAPDQRLPEALYKNVDILCLNQPEVEAISQLPVTDQESAEKAARVVLEMGVGMVVVTLGSQGCLMVQAGEEAVVVEGEKVNHVVDTSGAGDSFLGAFAYFHAMGKSIHSSFSETLSDQFITGSQKTPSQMP